ERKSVGIEKFESQGAGKKIARGHCTSALGLLNFPLFVEQLGFSLKFLQPAIDRPTETLLFAANHAANDVLLLLQLREHAAERFHDGRHELFEEAGLQVELL